MDELEAIDRALPEADAKWPRRHGQVAAAVGLVAVLAGAVAVAASLRDHPTAAPTPRTVTSGSRISSVGPPRARPPACDGSKLTTEARAARVARTGRNPMFVQIVDTGREPCFLPRRAGLSVVDANGVLLPFGIRPTGASQGSIRVTPIAPVELDLDKYRCDVGDRADARTLLVDLRASGVLRVSIPANVDLAWCGAGDPGSVIEASSLEPVQTRRGAGAAVTLASRVDVGVACATPNSVRCGRLGIAVFPTGRLARIEASIGSYRVALHRTSGGYYQGFVDARDLTSPPFSIHADARGRWYGEPPATVTLRVVGRDAGGGLPFDVTEDVLVAAGWG